jgi:hypothetical protein
MILWLLFQESDLFSHNVCQGLDQPHVVKFLDWFESKDKVGARRKERKNGYLLSTDMLPPLLSIITVLSRL